MIGYLTKHLSNQQFGFMTGRSSLEARTQSSNADVIYLDLLTRYHTMNYTNSGIMELQGSLVVV